MCGSIAMKDGAGCIDEKNMTADIARRQKHIYAKSLVLQANVSTSMEQVALAMAPCSIPWPLSEWASDPHPFILAGNK